MKKIVALLCTIAACWSTPALSQIVVGRLGSLTNPISTPTTVAVGEGFDLMVKKVNSAGGVNGQQIKVVFVDDEFKPELTLKGATKLIEEDKVVAIINPQATPGSMAIIKDGLLKRTNTAIIGPFTGATAVLAGENVFPLRSGYDDETAALARQMKNLSQKRVACLFYNAGIGPSYAPIFAKIIKDNGPELVGSEGFDINPDPAKQSALVDAAIKKLAPARPDAIFILAVGPSMAMATKLINQNFGLGVVRYTFSINNWENLIKQAGLADAKGMVFSQAVPFPSGASRRISQEYQRDSAALAPQTPLSFAGLEGYMTAKVLIEALRRAGANPTREKVLRALNGMGRYDLGDYVVNYSPARRVVESTVDITIISSTGRLIK